MATNFVVNRMATLAANTPFSLQGIRAIRSGAEMSYKLVRTVLSIEAPGGEDTFEVSEALGAEEVRKVYVDSVLKSTPADYTVGDGDPDPAGAIVFGAAPAEGAVIEVKYESAEAAVVVAGGVTFFDTHKQNTPAWGSVIPSAETVVEIM